MKRRSLLILRSRLPELASRIVVTSPSWRTGKIGNAARGYGYDWQKFREQHLAAHPNCVFWLRDLGMLDLTPAEVVLACAESGVVEPLGNIGDHITPHQGDDRL